jgi:hypothetical protein
LLQPFQFGVDGGGAGEVGVEGGWLGVHRGLRGVIDDKHMNALFDQEAKLFIKSWLQLCHIDKMNHLCHADQDVRDEALRRWYSPPR